MGPCPTAIETLAALAEPGSIGVVAAHWDAAQAEFPGGEDWFAGLSHHRDDCGIAADAEPALAAVVERLRRDPPLARYAWYLQWRVFAAPQHGCPWGLPELERHLGELAGPFHLLLSLEFSPRLRACHRWRGYPAAVTADTLREVACFDANHRRGRGCPGVYARQFPWYGTYLNDPYVRLGRLEFQLHGYGGEIECWRRGDGAALVLAEDGTAVGADGLCGADGWTARLGQRDGHLIGHPVDPAGRILRREVRLPLAEWKPWLRRGDPVLDLHIPAGGGLDPEASRDAVRRALDFFPRHHPGSVFRALVCSTWFLDPRLADLLPATANPLRWQRSAWLYPVPPHPDGLWFVFLRSPTDPASLPRDTSLQRSLADFLVGGGRWHGGGMMILPEDLAALEEGVYSRRWAALSAELPGDA